MLQLKNIVKQYKTGDTSVDALNGVSLSFRKSEFVSILGPSGCGKTTMLNIVGGLDVYTSGDLIINGRSTKEFKSKDWDTYRNHSIGFVFQSYNLIGHQTVLSNVELALTLSGVSKSERRKRAKEALEMVGLGDQLHKKPNQMSGGQMQRVAIARALVNDPDILLADEPTGALDTATSVQIMEILKEISKDRLIIMVTHNPELAEKYSTRIVKLLDGKVMDDSMPYTDEMVEADTQKEKSEPKKLVVNKGKKTKMSFFTALSLSFNNLMTKRGRTLLTSFAGSIGIIGISLILALSTGIQAYINTIQEDTLGSYPLTIQAEEGMIESMLTTMTELTPESMSENKTEHGDDAIYSNPLMFAMFNTFYTQEDADRNNLTAFKEFIDKEMNPETSETDLYKYASEVYYSYDIPMNTFVKNQDGEYVSTEIKSIYDNTDTAGADPMLSSMMSMSADMMKTWIELPGNNDGTAVSEMAYDQYDLIYGEWPSKASDVVLILDQNNEVPDIAFYAMGLMTDAEVMEIAASSLSGEEIEIKSRRLSYENACGISFKLLLNHELYTDKDGDGIYEYIGDDKAAMDVLIGAGYDLNIVGVVKAKGENAMAAQMVSFAYTPMLTQEMLRMTAESELIKAQLSDEFSNKSVISGLPFILTEAVDPTDEYKAEKFAEYMNSLDDKGKAELYTKMLSKPTQEEIDQTVELYLSEYGTREKMEELAATAFGMNVETIRGYLEAYTDDELTEIMKEQIEEMVISQKKTQAEEAVRAIMNTPSDEEATQIAQQILSQITDPQMIIGMITQDWLENTTMDANTIALYLMGLSPEELNNAALSVAKKDAAGYYAQMVTDELRNKKAAEAFDAQFGGQTDTAVLSQWYDDFMPSVISPLTYDELLDEIGVANLNSPDEINIYATSFENKDKVSDIIADYNESAPEEDKIKYTDYVAMLMSGITDIINAISYGLIAFVSISLVVSSIMIGIITYISVLERTKEIGILRSIGASKRDISLVFNAETLIVGFTAGFIGISISLLACIPINLLLHALTGITEINAFLMPIQCIVLVSISMILTLISGLIPSRFAAKKDPVEALRSE